MAFRSRRSTRAGIGVRPVRALVAVALALGLLIGGAACGFDVQTNKPYTPAEGVNHSVGNPPTVQVRNLMVLSRDDGFGWLSATITSGNGDVLSSVAGKPVKADYADGAPFTVTQAPVRLNPGALVILTQQPSIELRSADLVVGLEAEVTLTFDKAGELKTRVPIVDADEQPYATITPSPAPSA